MLRRWEVVELREIPEFPIDHRRGDRRFRRRAASSGKEPCFGTADDQRRAIIAENSVAPLTGPVERAVRPRRQTA